jgi:hypothetical protein
VPNLELLDPRRHGHLRLRAQEEPAPHFVQVLTGEFAVAAACCPILFTKDPGTGSLYAGAMLGFKADDCLLGTADARGGFTPLALQRAGFYISDQHIAIDRDHPRFGEIDGEPLFDDAGQPGNRLRAIQRILGEITTGLDQTKAFIAAVSELKLIEPIDVSLTFDDGERLTLQGLYTVSLDRLRDVDDAAALRLFRSGHLQFAYTMSASLKQIARLARLRNARH